MVKAGTCDCPACSFVCFSSRAVPVVEGSFTYRVQLSKNDKARPITCHEGTERESRGIALLFL